MGPQVFQRRSKLRFRTLLRRNFDPPGVIVLLQHVSLRIPGIGVPAGLTRGSPTRQQMRGRILSLRVIARGSIDGW